MERTRTYELPGATARSLKLHRTALNCPSREALVKRRRWKRFSSFLPSFPPFLLPFLPSSVAHFPSFCFLLPFLGTSLNAENIISQSKSDLSRIKLLSILCQKMQPSLHSSIIIFSRFLILMSIWRLVFRVFCKKLRDGKWFLEADQKMWRRRRIPRIMPDLVTVLSASCCSSTGSRYAILMSLFGLHTAIGDVSHVERRAIQSQFLDSSCILFYLYYFYYLVYLYYFLSLLFSIKNLNHQNNILMIYYH